MPVCSPWGLWTGMFISTGEIQDNIRLYASHQGMNPWQSYPDDANDMAVLSRMRSNLPMWATSLSGSMFASLVTIHEPVKSFTHIVGAIKTTRLYNFDLLYGSELQYYKS